MPWKEVLKVDLRMLLVSAKQAGKEKFSRLCRQFGVSRKTGYKWVKRYGSQGPEGLMDKSRRPHSIGRTTACDVVDALVRERQAHPYWGARKLSVRLANKGIGPPSERTANRILKRAGLVESRQPVREEPRRFQRQEPNQLWQVDHKAAVHGAWSRRMVPLMVLDDCTRFILALRSLPDKGLDWTWAVMWEVLGEFGLPEAVLSDNDQVFAGTVGPSHFEARLMRLGIRVCHGRPYHPQTQGKVERANGTLELELLRDGSFRCHGEMQPEMDRWRRQYNYERPHEALDMAVPGSLYRPSPRRRPDSLPDMEYAVGTVLRRVQKDGLVSWKGYHISVGTGLHGQAVEVRELDKGIEVYFGPNRITAENLEGRPRWRESRAGNALAGETPLGATPRAAFPPPGKCNPCVGTDCNLCRDH